MTQYILNQLKALCDKPQVFVDALEYWDYKPERESEAIRRILNPFHLQGLLVNAKLNGKTPWGTILTFKTKGDPNEYMLMGVHKMSNGEVHIALAIKMPAKEQPN